MNGSEADSLASGSGAMRYRVATPALARRHWFASQNQRIALAPPLLLLSVLIGVVWLATRPYRGVYHDGRFYAIEALNLLLPGRFSDDPYFNFGSQGDFTIYTRLYAPLISLLGLPRAAMLATIAGQALWLCGLVRLALALALVQQRAFMLLAIGVAIGLPASYGIFTYGEAWVTPRLFVEALTLFALGFLVRRHYARALLMLAIAAPIHPLMTLPGLAFALVYLALERPLWWLVAGAGAILGIGLALAGVPPLANLFAVYDPEWFEVVKYRDPFCLIGEWAPFVDLQAASTVVLAAMGLVAAEGRARRLLITAVIVGLGGVLCTFVGGDLLHDVFVVEIQPWRSMWLLAVTANLFAVPAFLRLVREGGRLELARTLFLAAAVPLLLSQFLFPFIFVAAPALAIAAALAVWQLTTGREVPVLARLAGIFVVEFSAIVTLICFYGFTVMREVSPDEFRWRAIASALLLASLAVMIAVTMRRERPTPWLGRALALIVAALLGSGLYAWDTRPAWARFIESPEPLPASLATLLPQDASIYWEDGLEMLWFRLNRPSYFSCDQGTGSLFYRGTAMEYWNRAQSFWPLRTRDFGVSITCPVLDKQDKPERTRADVEAVCRREPSLDYLVLARPVEDVAANKVWLSPARLRGAMTRNGQPELFETDRFYVYSCADRR